MIARVLRIGCSGLITLILIVSTLLLGGLINVGFLSADAAYIERVSPELLTVPGTTAFVNVTIVDVTGDVPLRPNYTVFVEGERIISVAPTNQISIPSNATVTDGTGRYLMPGLVDAHVHVKDENELLLFIAAGVTSVRDMWGTTGVQLSLGFADQLAMQWRINEGDLLGPTIYTAGPIMEGVPAVNPLMETFTTVEAAQQSVDWQAAQGYQYVKVYDHLTPTVYDVIITEAAVHTLPVIGHVPYAGGLDRVIASGQHSIEHLTGFVDPDAATLPIEESELDEDARRIAEADIWICPTLVLYTRVLPDDEAAVLLAQPEMSVVPLWQRALWLLFNSGLRDGLRYQGEDYPAAIERLSPVYRCL